MIKNKRALTLIELLAVIAIIAILFILLIPTINSSIVKAREIGILTDFNSYRIGALSAINESLELSEESLNKNLDELIKFDQNISKKKNPFGDDYYLFITEGGYNFITESNGKKHILTVDTEGNSESSFGEGEMLLGGDIISKPNDKEFPNIETNPKLFEYREINDEEIAITRYLGTNKNVVVPKTIDGKKVVMLDTNSLEYPAFFMTNGKGKIQIQHLTLPEGIKEIGNLSVVGNGMKTIQIPKTLEKIGGSSFNMNPNLKFYISEENPFFKTDEENAGLYSKDGKSIYVGTDNVFQTETYSKIERIEIYAFLGNEIGMVFIPKKLNYLHSYAFMENSNLKFNVEQDNMNLAHGENNEGLYSKNFENLYFGSQKTFNTSTYQNIKKIDANAFYGADITKAYIPKNVNYIAPHTFKSNPNIKFEVDDENQYFTEGENGLGLYSKDKTVILTGTKDVIGTDDFNNVKIISPAAFYDMNLEGEFVVPNGVEEIGNQFVGFNRINKLVLPKTLRIIGEWAFSEIPYLEEVDNDSTLDLRSYFGSHVKVN